MLIKKNTFQRSRICFHIEIKYSDCQDIRIRILTN